MANSLWHTSQQNIHVKAQKVLKYLWIQLSGTMHCLRSHPTNYSVIILYILGIEKWLTGHLKQDKSKYKGRK